MTISDPIIAAYDRHNRFGGHFGMQLIVNGQGNITYRMRITADHLAFKGLAHGGVVAGMMDGVLGVAALSSVAHNKQVVATVEFKINYLAPVDLGDELTGHGTVIRSGKRMVISRGEILKNGKVPVASALGTFTVIPLEKSPLNELIDR